MRLNHVLPVLMLAGVGATARADVVDNLSSIEARYIGYNDNYTAFVSFYEEHIVFFETPVVVRGKAIGLDVSITSYDGHQWRGSTTLPTRAATFGANYTSATVSASILLQEYTNNGFDPTGNSQLFTVNVRLDGVGDITSIKSTCKGNFDFPDYQSKTISKNDGKSREAVLASGSLKDESGHDYLSGLTPGYPLYIQTGRVFFNNPGSL